MKVTEAQKLCLENGIPFYSYRLPGEQDFYWGTQTEGEILSFGQWKEQERGFVLVPFIESEKVPSRFIREDIAFRNVTTDESIRNRLVCQEKKKEENALPEPDPSREEYEQQVSTLVSFLQKGKMHKAVLSRTLTFPVAAYKHAARWFTDLAHRYPEAFVYLVYLPGELCWLGATPEIFLRQSANEIGTMALAGTRKCGTAGEWGEKEIEEQALVTDYIWGILETIGGGSWERKGPFSRPAGTVEHLCTLFRHKGRLTAETTDRLRRALHPTPAVGGVPPEIALDMIRQVEQRNRRYYAGYLGPVDGNGCLDWFVNLRCMELWPDRIRLFVGGGITAQSDPRSEWEETIMKSKTLLDVIQVDL